MKEKKEFSNMAEGSARNSEQYINNKCCTIRYQKLAEILFSRTVKECFSLKTFQTM